MSRRQGEEDHGAATLSFHSPRVRQILIDIIEGYDHKSNANSNPLSGSLSGSLSGGSLPMSRGLAVGIRGKWHGYHSSSDEAKFLESDSSSSPANEESGAESGGEDPLMNDLTSSFASSSMTSHASSSMTSHVTSNVTSSMTSVPKRSKPPKKTKHKKGKDDILKRMGSPPSILVPLHNPNGPSRQALQVPVMLLPPNYARDHPSWDAPSVASKLLSAHDRLQQRYDRNECQSTTIIVLLLQSGRFAGAVYSLPDNRTQKHANEELKLIAHKTSTRYTTRKGQGGSQSNHDQSKNKAKSIGAQLRRAGEIQLRDDVRSTLRQWQPFVEHAAYIFVSCPKVMRREYLFSNEGCGIGKEDERIRNVPLDVGRPTLEAAMAVLECVMLCRVQKIEECITAATMNKQESTPNFDNLSKDARSRGENNEQIENTEKKPPPLTPLHEAVIEGDLTRVNNILKSLEESEEHMTNDIQNDLSSEISNGVNNEINNNEIINDDNNNTLNYDVNSQGGPNHYTPLHYASISTHPSASSILHALLLTGHADPCIPDSHGRPPYSLANTNKQQSYRIARHTLGEDYCSWEDAKVGPPLSMQQLESKKSKEAEKKRLKRMRQKEKKAAEKKRLEEEQQQKMQQEQKRQQMEDAKRKRDGLLPKQNTAATGMKSIGHFCDFCQTKCKKSQMFHRLQYDYCTMECVKKHQRELMALAASRRMEAQK